MFVLNRIVIHEVIKEARSTDALVDLSETLGDQEDETFKALVERINDTFGSTNSLKNSHFDENADTVFSTLIKEYINDPTPERFYGFSRDSIENLRDRIEQESLATGGFYCFADYNDFGRRCVAVILLRRKDSFNFTKTDGIFKAEGGETINYDKIAMGFRLNVGVYEDEGDHRNYIALITAQHDQISTYFKEWVSVTGVITRARNTRTLVTLVKALPIPEDENGEHVYSSVDSFRKAVFDYVEESPHKRVSLTDIATYFYGTGEERKILDLADERELQIDNEFVRDKPTWKKVVSIKAEIAGVKLLIDFDIINEGLVEIHQEHVVIRSRDLVQQIRIQQNE